MEGTNTLEDRQVTLSASAARRIRELQGQDEFKGMFLRVAVSGGGCSGFQYGFSFDNERQDEDRIFEGHGVEVVVDDTSLDLLKGSEIDFVEEMVGASFRIKNPNAASSCGCGSSFSVG